MQAGGQPEAAPPPIIRGGRVERLDPDESAALLKQELINFNNCQNSKQTLEIDLEPGLPGIRNMEDRDRFETE